MTDQSPSASSHLLGEGLVAPASGSLSAPVAVDTAGGRVQVRWDPDAQMTTMGQLVFFAEFVHASGWFEDLVQRCPLARTSPNAPGNRDVLGTVVLGTLSGAKRYAHLTGLRNDAVAGRWLGMSRVLSEDAVRRGMSALTACGSATETWINGALLASALPVLEQDWILDIDVTVKPIFGHQEGAVIGYNPHKPGRPSHAYHTYIVGGARLILATEVRPGNETSPSHGQAGLTRLMDALEPRQQPRLIRGDSAYGTDEDMLWCERRGLSYLFKMRQSAGIRQLINEVSDVRFGQRTWKDAGQGWEGLFIDHILTSWFKGRRMAVIRRKIANPAEPKRRRKALPSPDPTGAVQTTFLPEIVPVGTETYEYAVLVTNLETNDILTIAQLYRDRADSENVNDELKNQWGWGGFTTADLPRCALIARLVALVYNWWRLFSMLVENGVSGREAITSRDRFLNAPARLTTSGGQRHLVIDPSHGDMAGITQQLTRTAQAINGIIRQAEQLAWAIPQRIAAVVRLALARWLAPADGSSQATRMTLLLRAKCRI